MKKAIMCVLCMGLAVGLTPIASSAVVLNELMISHTGTDDMEFIELCGDANETLTDTWILVIEGDATSATGLVDDAIDVSGALGPDGRLVVGGAAVAGVDIVVGATNLYENGTETILLVTGFTGTQGTTDVDTDDDGTADLTPFSSIIDGVGMIDGDYTDGTGTSDKIYYGQTLFGPDGTFFPAGVQRCPDCTGSLDNLLSFNLDGSDGASPITPDGPNDCPVTATENTSWGQVKGLYR